ncbi:hypothetical protein CEXT_651491, partial [Caerostris extrusa]
HTHRFFRQFAFSGGGRPSLRGQAWPPFLLPGYCSTHRGEYELGDLSRAPQQKSLNPGLELMP